MTVYELIQELVQHDADYEVVIDFTTKDEKIDIEEDMTEGSTITVDGAEKTGKDINVCSYNYDRRKIHIEVEED